MEVCSCFLFETSVLLWESARLTLKSQLSLRQNALPRPHLPIAGEDRVMAPISGSFHGTQSSRCGSFSQNRPIAARGEVEHIGLADQRHYKGHANAAVIGNKPHDGRAD